MVESRSDVEVSGSELYEGKLKYRDLVLLKDEAERRWTNKEGIMSVLRDVR